MRYRSVSLAAITAAACLPTLLAPAAQAVTITAGTYHLANHPDGSERPPLYGARFDEIVNVTGGHDVFTADFDHAMSNMQLTINPALNQIHIFGQAWGGRDTGTAYANDAYLGVYQFDFLYNINVGPAGSDDDLDVSPGGHVNFGTITLPGGTVVNVTDEAMGGYSFRLGDEDNEGGHRNYSGISGWGWMSYVGANQAGAPTYTHVESTDWLFKATKVIPAPGSIALMGVGGLVALRRKR